MPVDYYGLHPSFLFKEVAVEQGEVGDLAGLDGSELCGNAENLGRRSRDSLERSALAEPTGDRGADLSRDLLGTIHAGGGEGKAYTGFFEASGVRFGVEPARAVGRLLRSAARAAEETTSGGRLERQVHQHGHIARLQQVGDTESFGAAVDDGAQLEFVGEAQRAADLLGARGLEHHRNLSFEHRQQRGARGVK